MKKLIFIIVFTLITHFSFGQTLQKGSLVGLHIMTVTLNPNVTMDQFSDFFINKVIPEYEKQFDAKGYLVKGISGDNNNSSGIIWLFKNEQSRDKYFNGDGSLTDAGKAAADKV